MMIKVTDGSVAIETDVTTLQGLVPEELIEQFKQVVENLEDYNEARKKYNVT